MRFHTQADVADLLANASELGGSALHVLTAAERRGHTQAVAALGTVSLAALPAADGPVQQLQTPIFLHHGIVRCLAAVYEFDICEPPPPTLAYMSRCISYVASLLRWSLVSMSLAFLHF